MSSRRQRIIPAKFVAAVSAALVVTIYLAAEVASACADDARELVYVKCATRQETLEATLAASGRAVLKPWYQVGPFDPILRRPMPAEQNPALDETYRLHGGGEGTWQLREDYLDGFEIELNVDVIEPAILEKQPTLCLRRGITTSEATRLKVYFGCDAEFTVWLNGQPLFISGPISGIAPGQESIELELRPGENVLAVKVALQRLPCRFFFMPELGEAFNSELLAALKRDFPTGQKPAEGYRDRAGLESAIAENRYYRLVEIEPPPGVVIEGGGMDLLPDGRLAVSTRRGFVYLVENPAANDPAEIIFHRYASGLHDALGLAVIGQDVCVVNRGEVTRLLDTDGDGVADRFECLANDWGLTGNYHEYAYGLAEDGDGNLYVPLNVSFTAEGSKGQVPYRGCVVRITPLGTVEPVCGGLRSPNGIGTNTAGDIFVTDNQGEWVPACPVYHVREGAFFGHPASLCWLPELADSHGQGPAEMPPRTPPAVWLPYEELSQSATDIVCDETGGKFGPFTGQLFVGEMTKGLVARVQLEQVEGQYQGACFLLRRGCGAVNRMTFGPEGHLYFSRCNRGWGGGGLGEGLARLEYTGTLPLEVLTIHIRPDGFELTFTKPLAEDSAARVEDYQLEQYRYHNWAKYGSPRIDVETVAVESVERSADRRRVRLRTSGLKTDRVCRFQLGRLESDDGDSLLHRQAHYTVNAIPR